METIRLRLRLEPIVAAGLRRIAWNRSLVENKFVSLGDLLSEAARHYLEQKRGRTDEHDQQ